MKRKVTSIFIVALLSSILCTGCQKGNNSSLAFFENTKTAIISTWESKWEVFSIIKEKDKEIIQLICEEREGNPKFKRVSDISVPTEDELKTYLNMTIGEIEKLTGMTINDDGTLMIFSFAAYFPCLDLEDSSFYFVCSGNDKTQKPRYISFYGEYYEEYLSTIGLSCTMGFEEIKEIWGEGELMINQRGETDDYRYMLSYERNGLRYDFVSRDKEGYNFEFYIDLE